MVDTDLLTLAKMKNNFEADATGGTLWDTTTSFKVVCPPNKRWFLVGGYGSRAVSSTMQAYKKDAADNIILVLANVAAATGIVSIPNNGVAVDSLQVSNYIVIDAGEYIEYVFGTAQNASSKAACVVLEIDV